MYYTTYILIFHSFSLFLSLSYFLHFLSVSFSLFTSLFFHKYRPLSLIYYFKILTTIVQIVLDETIKWTFFRLLGRQLNHDDSVNDRTPGSKLSRYSLIEAILSKIYNINIFKKQEEFCFFQFNRLKVLF